MFLKFFCLFMCVSSKRLFTVYPTLMSFKKYNAFKFDFILYIDDSVDSISEKDLDIINKAHKTVKVLTYKRNKQEVFSSNLLKIRDYVKKDNKFSRIASDSLMAKLYILKLAQKYRHVYYCDTDICFIRTIEEFIPFNTLISTRRVEPKIKMIARLKTDVKFSNVNFDNPPDLGSSSIMVNNNFVRTYKTFAETLENNFIYLMINKDVFNDEYAWMATLSQFNIYPSVYPFDSLIELADSYQSSSIHAMISAKFWRSELLQHVVPLWKFFYEDWVAMGGGVLVKNKCLFMA